MQPYDVPGRTAERRAPAFHSSLAGFCFLVLSFAGVQWVGDGPDSLGVWRAAVPFPFFGTALGAVLIGLVAWIPVNLVRDREKASDRTIELSDDDFEILVRRAVRSAADLSIILKSGRILIGPVLGAFNPMYDRKYLAVVLLASGYRRPDTDWLVLATGNLPIYRRLREPGAAILDPAEYQIVVPIAEIESISLFDRGVYGEVPAKGHRRHAVSSRRKEGTSAFRLLREYGSDQEVGSGGR